MNKNWKDLKILLAGCGSIGRRHARILRGLGVEQIFVFDTNDEQVQLLIKELAKIIPINSFEDGLKVADAVFILTPSKLHVPMALQALESGCHVFIEKPLSVTLDGVAELQKLANEMNRKVMVGLCFRYHEGIKKTKEILDSGKIGRLVSIRSLVGEHFPSVHPEYKTMYYAKYSGAFELMHDLDLALWFAGQPVKKVHSVYGSFSDIDIEAPDTVEFLLQFVDRCTATVHLDFYQKPRRRNMELISTEGVLIIDFSSWDEYKISIFNSGKNIWEHETGKTARDDMFIDEDREFLECIVEDRPVSCNIEEGCRSLHVIEAAQKNITEPNRIEPIK